MKYHVLFIFLALLAFVAIPLQAEAKDFTSDNKKALVLFATKASPYDVQLMAWAVDLENKKIIKKGGFGVSIGRGTPLFGPYTGEYETNSSKKIKLQKKKVKPGTYMLINGHGRGTGDTGGGGLGCFSSETKLFTVKAGEVYLMTIPDAKPVKEVKNMNWALDPKVSNAELMEAYENYLAANSNIQAKASILPYKMATFEHRIKFGFCLPSKSGQYEIVSP